MTAAWWAPARASSPQAAVPPAEPLAAPAPPAAAAPAYQTIVTVPAPPASAPRADSIAAASVVFPAESPRAFDDLGDLLVEVPGVVVTRSAAWATSRPSRCAGPIPTRCASTSTASPLAVASGGSIEFSTLPLGDVERIEIYRGTTPIGFAESALGGIVSITSARQRGRRDSRYAPAPDHSPRDSATPPRRDRPAGCTSTRARSDRQQTASTTTTTWGRPRITDNGNTFRLNNHLSRRSMAPFARRSICSGAGSWVSA